MIHHTLTKNFKAAVLSDEELRVTAPSVFANGPMTGLSSRYTFVPTTEIVAGLREKHWLPVAVEQQRVRTSARFGFQKHLIRFRRAEQMQTLDEWNPELVLTNSHDAGCAYILRVGTFANLRFSPLERNTGRGQPRADPDYRLRRHAKRCITPLFHAGD
ncbi:MAG: DUF932 domain-containing protein [Verrucomicrobiales bacterium]|nr:DUF932 domain-containing protein [Verrucomicrobiales bacterium]